MEQKNKLIRDTAKQFNIPLWMIAEKYGCNDGNFSRKLRHELPKEESEKIMSIINELKAGK